MIIAIIVVVVLALLAVCWWHSTKQVDSNVEKTKADFFTNTYKEDIDFSLLVKGYPVVNDMDIAYTNWLAGNPEKIRI